MNNSLLATNEVNLNIETQADITPILREKSVRLQNVIESLDAISESNFWKILQKEIFDGIIENLHSRLDIEKDTCEIFRLQGQIQWAKRYSNLKLFADEKRKELVNLTQQIK